MLKYLIDENLSPVWRTVLLKAEPQLVVRRVGDPGQPSAGTPDPEILDWCFDRELVLVTGNRRSMPLHLSNHIANGKHIPGIFCLPSNYRIAEMVDNLVLVAGAALPDEFVDQIRVLPIS